jgi:hypothetical protein
MPSDGTIGGLVGKLDVLRVECPTCGRQGRYHVARLLEELGAGARLTDWLNERTADCPQKNSFSYSNDDCRKARSIGVQTRQIRRGYSV